MRDDRPAPPDLLELATEEQRVAMWRVYQLTLAAWEQRRACDVLAAVVREGDPGWQQAVCVVLDAGMARVRAAQEISPPTVCTSAQWNWAVGLA